MDYKPLDDMYPSLGPLFLCRTPEQKALHYATHPSKDRTDRTKPRWSDFQTDPAPCVIDVGRVHRFCKYRLCRYQLSTSSSR